MNKVDWSKLIELQYWVEGVAGNTAGTPTVETNSFFFYLFTTTFVVFFGLGVFLLTSTKFLNVKNPLIPKFNVWGNNYIWMGILGMLWFLLRQIEIDFLGARIWLLAGLIWFIIIKVLIIKYFIGYFPLEWAYFKKNKSLK